MPAEGIPTLQVQPGQAEGMRVAVISAQWNEEITDQLHAEAIRAAEEAGAKVDDWRVAGALELPVVVAKACKTYDAVVATGCVIEGETEHFRLVCDAVTYGLTKVGIESETPVGNGVLTVQTKQQAVDRAGGPDAGENKGADSATAAIHAALVLRSMSALS